jgi:hypothetical protein
VGTSERAYRSLLRAYPRELRDEYGEEMARCFRDLCREELGDGGGLLGLAALWARTLPELFYTALKERSTMLARNAYRVAVGVALAAAFVLVAVGVLGDEVDPDRVSLAVIPVIIIGAIIAYIKTKTHSTAYRWAVRVALAAAFILFWSIGGVGVLGSDDHHPADLMYIGVLAVGTIGAIVARFRSHGMARALFATALAQALVALIALIFGLGLPWSPPVEILAVNGFFVALFAGSALLFRYAGRERTPAGAGQEG